ncbi:40S ribosomal protein S27-like [Artibeus jamaicensis]|uniref:40S ribosomal protein S27-like n=1 Tax=Artibeus jamaicensis TaxID=9417 RepID=UPI00235A7717|nr:40S ribosomal protein S27-like [Artibeus jamaicensis]
MPLARDLVHPSLREEKKKHRSKQLLQSPNPHFTDVKCPGCYQSATAFSHAQTAVLCAGDSVALCQPMGGKVRDSEWCSFRERNTHDPHKPPQLVFESGSNVSNASLLVILDIQHADRHD